MTGAVIELPLSVAAQRLDRSLKRLGALSEEGGDAEFEEALATWFGDLKAFGEQLQRTTGLSAAELAERLVP